MKEIFTKESGGKQQQQQQTLSHKWKIYPSKK